MVNPVSPGVYIVEKDDSAYPPSIDSTTVGVVGFASKGPTNKATLITSVQNLVNTFGENNQNIPYQGLIGAKEILEATNRLYYVRAADSTAADASATVRLGACPAVAVSSLGIGVTSSVDFVIQVTTNDGASAFPTLKTFSVASGTATNQAKALSQAFASNLDAAKVGVHYPYTDDGVTIEPTVVDSTLGFIVGAYAGSAATLYVSANTPCLVALDASGDPTGGANSVLTVSGVSLPYTGAGSVGYLVESLWPGTGYNLGTRADGSTSGCSVEVDALGGEYFNVTVNEDGSARETFRTSLVTSKNFIHRTINQTSANAVSEYVKGNLQEDGATLSPTELTYFADKLSTLVGNAINSKNPRFVKFLEGTYSLAGGTNGTSSQTAALVDAIGKLNDDLLNLSVAVVPGAVDQSVQNTLVTLAETTQNFIACVSPPYGNIDTVQEAIDWTNGLSESRTAALNSSYAAVYWPWLEVFSPQDGTNVWLDPAIYGARQIAYTAANYETWFAPFGYVRGRLTKPIDVQVRLNQGDRDSMYSGGNVVNPIVNFPQQGITIWGQRTAQRAPTALDRINVRMLMIYLRKVLTQAAAIFVSEPNDQFLWGQITELANALMDDIKQRRGVIDFQVVCDETVNTPVRVDRNEVWCKIIIRPTKAAEIVVFELNLTNQSGRISG